ncbi:MAG: hypothetical protein DHS20C10_07030 [marine bacterium B5-7]|nr:MAG: hypothetical protein DHS20C10_07030 [marine bacterium B5-7]
MLKRQAITVKTSILGGWGVFADRHFLPGQLIEEAPLLPVDDVHQGLNNYYFTAKENDQRYLALGYGSLYNHAGQANIRFSMDLSRQVMLFHATRLIAPGEELCIDYGVPWFEKRDIPIRETSAWQLRWQRCSGHVWRLGLVCGLGALFYIFIR